VSTAALTGNFCSDIVKMGQRLDKIPPPVNKGNLPADQAYARAVLTQVEAAFNGLAAEAPPNVAAAIHNLTGVYQSEANNITNYGSLAQIKAQERKLTTDPAYLSAVRVLVMYMATKCG